MDLIHLYSFDPKSLKLTSITPVSVKAGSGPRHLAFVVKGSKTFAYLVTELGNTIIGYEVTYPKGKIQLTEFFNIPSHGAGPAEPSSYAVSEVVLSVSQRPLLFSTIYTAKKIIPTNIFSPTQTSSSSPPAPKTAPPSPTSTTLQRPSPPTRSSTSRSTPPPASSSSSRSSPPAASFHASSPSTRRATCSPWVCRTMAESSLSTATRRLVCWAALWRMLILRARLPLRCLTRPILSHRAIVCLLHCV